MDAVQVSHVTHLNVLVVQWDCRAEHKTHMALGFEGLGVKGSASGFGFSNA